MIKFKRGNFHRFVKTTDVGDLIFVQKNDSDKNTYRGWNKDSFSVAILLDKETNKKDNKESSPRYTCKIRVYYQDDMRYEDIHDGNLRVILSSRDYIRYFHDP